MNEHVANGQRFLDEENHAAAAAAFRQALETSPDDADARFGLADAVAGEGDAPAAIEAYRHALELETRGRAAAKLGELLIAADEPADRVVALLESTIGDDPDDPEPYVLLAELQTRAGNLGEADAQLRRGIRRGATLAPDKVFAFYQHWAADLVNSGDSAGAQAALDRAVTFFGSAGGGVELVILGAGVAEAAGDAAGAIQHYKLALDDLPPGPLRTQVLEKIAALV